MDELLLLNAIVDSSSKVIGVFSLVIIMKSSITRDKKGPGLVKELYLAAQSIRGNSRKIKETKNGSG